MQFDGVVRVEPGQPIVGIHHPLDYEIALDREQVVPAPLDDFADYNRDQWVNAVDFGMSPFDDYTVVLVDKN